MMKSNEDFMYLIIINFIIIVFLTPIAMVCFKRSDSKDDKLLGKFFVFVIILAIIAFIFRTIQYNINF